MANTKNVTSLLEEKRKILKEIKNLQNKCDHSHKSVKSIKEREDASTFVIRWICNNCKKVIGIPNKHETNKYLNGPR